MRDLGPRRPIRSGWLPAAAALIVLAGPGCGDTPTSPSALLPPSAPTVTSLTITGNASFTAVGQTSQLAAIASYSDRTTRDVTLEAEWQATDQSVITVSSSGLVTVVAFGSSGVRAIYASRATGTLQISAWPPGLFHVSGRVREPGQGGIENVRVLDPSTGLSTMTGRDGGFFLGGIGGPDLTFEKTGFEIARHAVGPNDTFDLAMQRIIRITAGDTVGGLQLAPHDVSYEAGGERCYPCRLVRILTSRAGTLRLSLTWTESRVAPLNIWVGGQRYTGSHPELVLDRPVIAGEVVVYLGMVLPPSAEGAPYYVPFRLVTAFE